MPGKSPPEAVQNYLDPLNLVISCITNSVLSVGGGYHPAPQPHVLMLNRGDPMPLRGPLDLTLSVIQNYRIVEDDTYRGPWKVQTAAYFYSIARADGREVIAYHWHPMLEGGPTIPHLHIGPGAEVGLQELTRSHLPSGRVTLEQVLRLAIAELAVEPRRPDWEEILLRTEEGYEAARTW